MLTPPTRPRRCYGCGAIMGPQAFREDPEYLFCRACFVWRCEQLPRRTWLLTSAQRFGRLQ